MSDELHDRLRNDFTYHAPSEEQVPIYESIRAQGWAFATHVVENVPPSRERSLALTKIEEAVFWANAGVARQGGDEDGPQRSGDGGQAIP